MAADTSRPTVLLADDDAGILAAISRTVAPDFQVVGTVTDGHQALDAVRRLDPDVAVLDISMPGLNGFETAAALKRSGARAKTVFLTAHQDDHFVARAINSGAMGYVPKTLAWSHLVPALRSALAGRQHLPSLAPLVITNADAHAVLFHENDGSWLERVSDVLSSALHRGDIVATALTRSNHDVLASCMHERGWNLSDLRTHDRYLVVDAEEAATRIMQSGRAHPESIAEMVTTLERARTTSAAAGSRSRLTIAGEIAVVLCRRGNPEAALELERLWDELTRSLPILTICAYPTDCCYPHPTSVFLEGISAHHSVVSHAVAF